MKFRSLLAATALAAAAFAGSNAYAATAGTIGDDNEYLPGDLDGYFGGNLYLVGGDAQIQVTIVGAEAGFLNSFTFAGTTWSFGNNSPGGVFNDTGVLAPVMFDVATGLLDFWFGVNGTGQDVVNGSNPDNSTAAPNFFVSFLPDPTATFGQSVMLFFDDGGSVDDNHDDLIVRLDIVKGGGTIAPVPLPAGGLLLIGALGGLALIRRRKSI
jgi:hypothetical protein